MHSSGVVTAPPSYLWQSVFCLLVFAPAAVVAIYYSVRVSARMAVDDWRGALRASRLARAWCLVSLLGGLVAVAPASAGLIPTFSSR
ncbi:MAG: CD225/dispanin family protein [Acidimicrobiales bacterium]